MRLALDADVCIYAVTLTPWTSSVRALLTGAELVGSALLPVELLPKPKRLGARAEVAALTSLLAGLRLLDVSLPIAVLATELATEYTLTAVDAVHLATARSAGADAFVTNNTKDFANVQIGGLGILHPQASD